MAVSLTKVWQVFDCKTGLNHSLVYTLPRAKAVCEQSEAYLDYEPAPSGFYLSVTKGGRTYVKPELFPTRGEADKRADWLNMSDDFATYATIFNP